MIEACIPHGVKKWIGFSPHACTVLDEVSDWLYTLLGQDFLFLFAIIADVEKRMGTSPFAPTRILT